MITAFQNDPTTDNIFKDFEIFEAILGKQETKQLQLLKSKLLRSTALQPYVEATEIYVSFHPEKDKISTLITIPTVDKIKDVDLPALLTSLEKKALKSTNKIPWVTPFLVWTMVLKTLYYMLPM